MLRCYQRFIEPETLMWRRPLGSPVIDAAFTKFGIHMVDTEDAADVILTDARVYMDEDPWPVLAKMSQKPHVIIDSADQATAVDGWTGPARQLLKLPQVKFLMKTLYYNSIESQNVAIFEGTRFGQVVHDAADHFVRPKAPSEHHYMFKPDPMTPAELRKLVSICNPLWQDGQKYIWAQFNPSQHLQPRPRTLDATFLGCGGWYTSWSTRYHRHRCVEAMRQLPDDMIVCAASSITGEARHRVPGWPNGVQHFDMLLNSRIGVSPWGFSEHSIRDYEVALAGCVLVKPHMSNLSSWPDVINDPATIECDPHFRDLEQVIRTVMLEWDKYEQLALDRADRLWRCIKDPTAMVREWSKLLYKAAEHEPPIRITAVSTKRVPQTYTRPLVSVGVISWPCHAVRVEYLRQCLESLRNNLLSPYDYELVVSLEPKHRSAEFDRAVDIVQQFGGQIVVHDDVRGYGPHHAFLLTQLAGNIKVCFQDDHVLPQTLDLLPFIDSIAADPSIGLIALGEANNGYVLEADATPAEHSGHMILLSPTSHYLYSDGPHIRTNLLAEAVGLHSPITDMRAEWEFNLRCRKAAEDRRVTAYVSRVNYRRTVGTWSTCADGDHNLFKNPPSN